MERTQDTVYIVDDDASVCRSLSRLLTAAGYLPVVFHSMESFLAQGHFKPSSCVIADLQMGGASGLELQKRLRSSGIELPVILLTAHDTVETRESAKRAGITGYFRKPVDDQALIDSIEWALSGGAA